MSGGVQRTASLLPSLDPLTGVYDRTTVLSMLFRETDRAQRMNTALCLLVIGIEVTPDAFPYPTAPIHDELLRQATSRITRQLRSYDLLGRMGENAFLAVLPGCETADAALLAERIIQNVFAKPFLVGCNSVQLTVRFGIAASEGRSPTVVLREAEEVLRKAPGAAAEQYAFQAVTAPWIP